MIQAGDQFGEWNVLRRGEKISYWLCRCSCGFEAEVYTSTLSQGRSTRCKTCRHQMSYLKDRVGRRIGTLTVLSYAGRKSGRRNGKSVGHWLCKCDCGNEVEVRIDNLNSKSRKNKTCGCGRSGSSNYSWKGCGDLSGEKWGQICKSARERDIEVAITIQDAWDLYQKQDGKCALTGWPLVLYVNGRSTSSDTDASLDRIDSSKGYILDNIQWVHKHINQAKNDLIEYDFIDMCKAVVDHRR